jgi:hypothetical protein
MYQATFEIGADDRRLMTVATQQADFPHPQLLAQPNPALGQLHPLHFSVGQNNLIFLELRHRPIFQRPFAISLGRNSLSP